MPPAHHRLDPRTAPVLWRPPRTVTYMPIVNDDLPFDLPWPEGRTPAEFSARAFGGDAASPAERAAGLVMVPFRGVRYTTSVDLAAVTSPPYDLIDDEAVRRLLAVDPHNIVRL